MYKTFVKTFMGYDQSETQQYLGFLLQEIEEANYELIGPISLTYCHRNENFYAVATCKKVIISGYYSPE